MCPYQTIIKLPQTVWELWPAQDFGMRGDKYKMEKVTVLLNTTCLLVLIPNIIKIFQTTYSRIYFEIHSGEVTRKQPWQMLSLLHVTRLLFDTNASTKCYQNMSKGIKVMERTRFWLQGMKKKLRVVSLA